MSCSLEPRLAQPPAPFQSPFLWGCLRSAFLVGDRLVGISAEVGPSFGGNSTRCSALSAELVGIQHKGWGCLAVGTWGVVH